MILDISIFILLVASAVILLMILFRKFSILATMDVDSVPQEKVEKKKEDIIEMRLRRKLEWLKNNLNRIIKPIFGFLNNIFKLTYQKVLELEKSYQEKSQAVSDDQNFNQQKTRALLSEGEELYNSEDYGQSEKKFIQVISLDYRNVEAYDGLGKVYLAQKDYEHAIEAFQHALKLEDKSSGVHCDICQVYKELGDFDKAVLYIQKAIELDPNNPKYLDALIEISILKKNRFLAKEAYRKLKKVNPENQKLSELEKKIENI